MHEQKRAPKQTAPGLTQDGSLIPSGLRMHEVYYYERLAPFALAAAPAAPSASLVLKWDDPSCDFYRYLFNAVGTPYRWSSRKLLNDQQLQAELTCPGVTIYVLYYRGEPAGYSEFNCDGKEAELLFFGLRQRFHGLGLGSFLLQWTLGQLVNTYPDLQKIWLHTCEFDHERARTLYEKHGFNCVKQQSEEIDLV